MPSLSKTPRAWRKGGGPHVRRTLKRPAEGGGCRVCHSRQSSVPAFGAGIAVFGVSCKGHYDYVGMRSLVPSLVAAGWENFFLDLRQDLWTVTVVPKPHTHAPGAHHPQALAWGGDGQGEVIYEEV